MSTSEPPARPPEPVETGPEYRTDGTRAGRRRAAVLAVVAVLAVAGLAAVVAFNNTRQSNAARVAASGFPVRGQTLITPAEPGVEEARPVETTPARGADSERMTVASRHPMRAGPKALRAVVPQPAAPDANAPPPENTPATVPPHVDETPPATAPDPAKEPPVFPPDEPPADGTTPPPDDTPPPPPI